MVKNFVPTHKITWNGIEHMVMLVDGATYTESEWDACDGADWSFDEDGLLFQGQVPLGESVINKINRGDK